MLGKRGGTQDSYQTSSEQDCVHHGEYQARDLETRESSLEEIFVKLVEART